MKNATKIAVSVFGSLAALAGAEHGVGEVLQGNVAPSAIVIESWPNSAFFRILGGEPAMTLVPHILVSGLLSILVSVFLLLWVTVFVERRNAGLTIIALSIILLLVGGGFGPPILGVIVGSAATRIHAPRHWLANRISHRQREVLAMLWPWMFGICVSAWLYLLPGIGILAYTFGVDDANLVLAGVGIAFTSLLLTFGVGFVVDGAERSFQGGTPLVDSR